MKSIKNFNEFLNESIDPKQEALNILDDIMQERDPEEIQGMTEEDALETVMAYGHEGKLAKKIARILHSEAEGL